MAKIPPSHRDLFEKRAFAHLATVMPDGSPQVTPVWVDFDGQYVLVNTACGRQKSRNVERAAKVVQRERAGARRPEGAEPPTRGN